MRCGSGAGFAEMQDIRHELFWNLGGNGEIFGSSTSGLNSLDTPTSFPSSSTSSLSSHFFLSQNLCAIFQKNVLCHSKKKTKKKNSPISSSITVSRDDSFCNLWKNYSKNTWLGLVLSMHSLLCLFACCFSTSVMLCLINLVSPIAVSDQLSF